MAEFFPERPYRRRLRSHLVTPDERSLQRRYRHNRLAVHAIRLCGYAVVASLALMFLFLFFQALPLLRPATLTPLPATLHLPPALQLLHADSRAPVIALQRDGTLSGYQLPGGEQLFQHSLSLADQQQITLVAQAPERPTTVVLGLSDGTLRLLEYSLLLQADGTPALELSEPHPLSITLNTQGEPLKALSLRVDGDGQLHLAAISGDRHVFLWHSGMANEAPLQPLPITADATLSSVQLAAEQGLLYLGDQAGYLSVYDLTQAPIQRLHRIAAGAGQGLTHLQLLHGDQSLISANRRGQLVQWQLLVTDESHQHRLTPMRSFDDTGRPVTHLLAEPGRKGFISVDQRGELALYYPSAGQSLLRYRLGEAVESLSLSRDRTQLQVQLEDGSLRRLKLDNPHPQISLRTLWRPVSYEGYAEPELIWQSNPSSDRFEAKFSLLPLAAGTLKAAFFAMLFAVPLAIAAAIYTACFMPARQRALIKPTIELMEAMPTVILGFIAGLWLAPWVEQHLAGFLTLLLLLPVSILLVGFGWQRLMWRWQHWLPAGWQMPVLLLILPVLIWALLGLAPALENLLFGGDLRLWLNDAGISYAQRNALVIGLVMGFAIIPSVYSIAEDALFNVPAHLTQGSMALGASPWQTVRRVVLPLASAGIFSAIMIGFGRALGETMILMMASGNAALMSLSPFEGMRTLSANLAIELPETTPGSTHYRVLVLAALLLLIFTFIINTLAELVRQRLRRRYRRL